MAGQITAGRQDEAASGRTGRRRVDSPRRQPCPVPPMAFRASRTTVLNIPPEARTNEIACKSIEEHNERLTRKLPADYPKFIRGTKTALRSWLLTSVSTPNRIRKSFSCNAFLGIMQSRPGKYMTIYFFVPQDKTLHRMVSYIVTTHKPVESKTRTYHGWVDEGRPAGRRGGARPGKKGCRLVGSPKR